MSDINLQVEELSANEAADMLHKHRASQITQEFMGIGIQLLGEADITCRDVNTGEVVWQHTQTNVVTDYGRRKWMENAITQMFVGFCSSTETPSASRYSLPGPSLTNDTPVTAQLSPTVNVGLLQRIWTGTIGVPTSTRLLGTVILGLSPLTNPGFYAIAAYLLLSPPRTQTTSQTIEVVYKITLNPIG